MDESIKAKFEERARILKTLAHPTRLLIVDELSRRERCVRELTALVGDDISTVSRHLAILKNAGIINFEKRGNEVHYILCCRCVTDFFSCAENVINKNKRK